MTTAQPRTARYDVLESIPDAVVISDARGLIVYANRRTEGLTGYRRRELVGSSIELLLPETLRIVHRAHRRDFMAGRARARAMGTADHEFFLRRKDGTELATDISLGTMRTADGMNVIAVIRDFTEHRRLESALEHQALHDPLTGLANRSLFFDRLRQAVSSSRRDQKPVALAIIDLDRFKLVNDEHGHAVGDLVLKLFAERLSHGLRESDTAARIGGDEFALLLPRIAGRRAAERAVKRRMSGLQGLYPVGRRRIAIAASAGVALSPEDAVDTDSLLRHADSAMYFAKREGRGVAFYPSTGPARGTE